MYASLFISGAIPASRFDSRQWKFPVDVEDGEHGDADWSAGSWTEEPARI